MIEKMKKLMFCLCENIASDAEILMFWDAERNTLGLSLEFRDGVRLELRGVRIVMTSFLKKKN